MKQPARTGYVLEDIYYAHETGDNHPECKERLDAARKALGRAELHPLLTKIPSRAAEDVEILYCHTPEYLELVKREVANGVGTLSTGDTDVCPRSLEAARHAAGGVFQAVDEVVSGRLRNAFCAPRPPGHHATASHGMGFCIFNNVALGAGICRRNG